MPDRAGVLANVCLGFDDVEPYRTVSPYFGALINPMDALVLPVGCDKTTPALLMGAASVDIPTIVVSGGPMLNGKLSYADIAAAGRRLPPLDHADDAHCFGTGTGHQLSPGAQLLLQTVRRVAQEIY